MTTPEKKKRGRWKTGESGNPSGRKPGTGEVAKLRDSIAAHLPEIITQLVSKAKEGDAQAARLLLERVLPPLRPTEQPVEIPLPDGDGLTAQGEAFMQAVFGGILAPGQGVQLITALGTLARITEIDELTARIMALEGAKHGNA